MRDPAFRGVGVALLTLFDEGGEVDAPATAELAAQLADAGVEAIVVAGSTGEAAALDLTEREDLIGAVRKALPDTCVVAGTGAPSARQAIELTRQAIGAGADAVLALSPPGTEDCRPYYDQLANVCNVPLLAYHFPAASRPGIPVTTLPDLPVDGLKDSSGDITRLLHELDVFPGWLYTGSADLVSTAGSFGCAGAILAIANAHPEEAIRAFGGDTDAQRRLTKLARTAMAGRHRSLKEVVAERFGTSRVSRLG